MNSKTYTYTADELRNKKSAAFLSAYSGGTVNITNVRFPGGHFELKFVKHEPITSGKFVVVGGDDGKFKEGDRVAFADSKKDRLTNAEKDTMIRKLTNSESGENEHLKFTFVPGLPGYVIISDRSAPVPIPGFQVFRWTNYKMENGFATTFEECLAKAMAHSLKNEE